MYSVCSIIVDVCGTEAADNCSLNAQCDNVDSELGFVCTCNPGYTGSGFNCTGTCICYKAWSSMLLSLCDSIEAHLVVSVCFLKQ